MKLNKKEIIFILDLLKNEIEYARTNIEENTLRLNKSKKGLNPLEKNKLKKISDLLSIDSNYEYNIVKLLNEIIKKDKEQIKIAKKLIQKIEEQNEIESK